MKKLVLIAIAAFGVMQANAQLSINPEVGLNLANVSGSGVLSNSKMNTGFKVGAMANIGISHGFYIEPGLMYSVKGYKLESSALGITATSKTALNYLEIPVNLGYQFDMGNAGGIFVAAGPYLGFGLNGKTKGSVAGFNGDTDIKFGDGTDELKKMDVGVNISAGYVSPIGIYFRAQYGLGLSEMSNSSLYSSKNRVLSFSVGYAFQLNEK